MNRSSEIPNVARLRLFRSGSAWNPEVTRGFGIFLLTERGRPTWKVLVMAGGWIKIEHSTPDKPEVMRIARTLGVSENEVLGGLVRFWLWCDYQSRDGHALGVTQTGLDRIAGVTGMYGAMLDAGWLTEDASGVHAPNYDYHLSENSKARALASKRKAKQRSSDVTNLSRCERDTSVTREEKRREEKKEEKCVNTENGNHERSWKADITIPFGWSAEATLAALERWVAFRVHETGREPSGLQLGTVVMNKSNSGWNEAKFVRAIAKSIEWGAKNICDPDNDRDKQRNGKHHEAPKCAPLPPVGTVTGWSKPERGLKFDIIEPAYEAAIANGSTKDEAMAIGRAAWKKYLDEHPEAR